MTRRREDLIEQLVADLGPAPRRAATAARASLWIGLSALYVAVLTAVTGPFRPGAFTALVEFPQFGVETAIGCAAAAMMCLIGFRHGIPGQTRKAWTVFAWALLAGWVAFYVAGLMVPSLEPSMVGKRPHCFAEVLVFSAVPLLFGLWLVRRLFTLHPIAAGASIGTASGMLPALAMQVACMYAPDHILQFHIAPILAASAAGALLGAMLLNRDRAG